MSWNPVTDTFLGEVRDVDDGSQPDAGIFLPWNSDPEASWLDYACWVEVVLDAGMALHKPLPQKNPAVDTLATVGIQDSDFNGKVLSGGGVNLASSSEAVDIIQRMASSTYTFVLRGYGIRVGYQVPIPGVKKIGDQVPVPVGKQYALNAPCGNFSGVPVWFGQWQLTYAVKAPLKQSAAKTLLPFNPAMHFRSDRRLPASIQVPLTPPDQRSVPARTTATLTAGRLF